MTEIITNSKVIRAIKEVVLVISIPVVWILALIILTPLAFLVAMTLWVLTPVIIPILWYCTRQN